MTGDDRWLAVNDFSFHRRADLRVAELGYSVEGTEIGLVRCDGLVVSTAAGSTGYNLANGGPVLAWGVEGFVVSFIAPHTLTARALVAAPDDVLEVENRSSEEPVDVTTDGRIVCTLEAQERMQVKLPARGRAAGPAAGIELLSPPARQVRPAGALERYGGSAPSGAVARSGGCS